MNTTELAAELEAVNDNHNKTKVYTLNDAGNLVPVTDVEVVIQRDSDGDVPIFVIGRD